MSGSGEKLRLEKKHPLAIRWFHWINFPVMSIMVWSGLLIYWATGYYSITLGGRTYFTFFPTRFYEVFSLDKRLAEGMGWHFFFAWIFAINGLLYVLFLLVSGEWRYLFPNRNSVKEAILVVLHDMFLTKKTPPRRKFNGAQQFAYTSIVLLGLMELLTGVAIYKPMQFSRLTGLLGGYEFARILHFVFMLAFVAFFLVHVMQVVRAGWNNFRAMVTGFELAPVEETPNV
ncbi:MAG: cytochrome b/b6 domain-containing protein [Armatimonadetes bacterium]|nr:cytochrome b/b6 domain-containing protein [Armatimonadota bacterium]